MKKFSNLIMVLLFVLAIFGCKEEKKEKDITAGVCELPIPAKYEVKIEEDEFMQNINGESIFHLDIFPNDCSGMTIYFYGREGEEIDIKIYMQHLAIGDSLKIDLSDGISCDEAKIEIDKPSNNPRFYRLFKGLLTREAENKFSFTATELETYKNGESYIETKNLTGYVVSDVIKNLAQQE